MLPDFPRLTQSNFPPAFQFRFPPLVLALAFLASWRLSAFRPMFGYFCVFCAYLQLS